MLHHFKPRRASSTHPRAAFTLIELMVVVAIIGVLAAIALPAFSVYVRKSRSAEATTNLSAMFKGAAAYYTRELASRGASATASGACTVPSTAGTTPVTPGAQKQRADFSTVSQYQAFAFSTPDPVFFAYGITSAGGSCGNTANSNLYTFYAIGDLDGDLDTGIIELAAESDAANTLRHAVGFYMDREFE